MFDTNSRYYALEQASYVDNHGREIKYKRRRFIPDKSTAPFTEVAVKQGERMDQISASVLGDPLHFWRICDANEGENPLTLCGTEGRRIKVPLPHSI